MSGLYILSKTRSIFKKKSGGYVIMDNINNSLKQRKIICTRMHSQVEGVGTIKQNLRMLNLSW
jgi:hypothetical protein